MTAEKLVRPSALLTMACKDALEIVGRDGSLRRLEGDTAALAEVVLAFCETPRDPSEVRAHIEALTGAPLGEGGVVDALVALLRETGALGAPIRRPAPRTQARVVIAMGGAVAASDAPTLVRSLQAMGLEVRVVASERALRFVAREALEALTHTPVLDSMWGAAGVPHVTLASWADLVVVWPATATMIGRLATGNCSELVSAVAITTRAPVLVAPSMNEAMLDAVSVARNIDRLRADGFRITASALAHEVAERPEERELGRGGAPDAASLARMIEALCRATVPEPRDAASWEAFHRRVPEPEQSWTGAEPDPVVMRLLEQHPGSLWDVGTGHGAIAIAAAATGRRVVATDVSETALARASERASDVVWIADDVTASRWSGVVDVVVDRGTLHTLGPERREAYVASIAAHTRSGSIVIITTIASADPRQRVHAMTSDEVTRLFGERFEPIDRIEAPFHGRLTPAPASVTTVLRRR